MFTSVRVFRLSNATLTNQGLNKIFTDLCENLLKVLIIIIAMLVIRNVYVSHSNVPSCHYVLNSVFKIYNYVCSRVFTSSCGL